MPILEGPNRGKRSMGLALEMPEARAVLDELVKRSDVFLTNFFPGAPAKLDIDLADIDGQPRHHLRARHRIRHAGLPKRTREATT